MHTESMAITSSMKLSALANSELTSSLLSLEGYLDPLEKHNLTDSTNQNCTQWPQQNCFLNPTTEAWKKYQRSHCPNLWTFQGALYFCLTVISTIGYGNMAPKTDQGRIFFIFYAIPGIGIFGVMIGRIQALMKHVIERGEVL